MRIDLENVKTVGRGLLRPEGVMAADDGTIYAADMRGCCARIGQDGSVSFLGNLGGVPNGICLDRAGNCIIANIGNGQVQILSMDGTQSILMTEAEGKRMPTPNFPFLDSKERLWVSNSTFQEDIDSAIRNVIPDGSVVRIDNGSAKIVAEGICFSNGIAVDPEEKYLYAAETMKRRILRFCMERDGSLGPPIVYGPDTLGPLGHPDGIAFDDASNLWITFPFWNAIGMINAREELEIILEDPDRKILQTPTNICFGGYKRRVAYVGSLHGSCIPFFEVPYSGARLIHQMD